MAKGANLRNLMFMKANERKRSKCEGKDREKHEGKPPKKQTRTPTVSDTEGYRIITELFKRQDAKSIVKMGSSAEVLGMTVLALAASVGHKDAVECLLEAKAVVNTQSPDGNYPLIQAVRGKFGEIVNLLLKKGAIVSLTNFDGDNAFMISVSTGDAKIINAIWPYRGDLDINHANKYGKTALHIATERRWEGCVEFLLLNGADTDRRNTNGCTPLFISVIMGDLKITEKLVAKGTDILIEDNEGYSAICRGVEADQDAIVEYLLTKLSNTQKEAYAKSRLEKLRTYALNENDRDISDPFFEVLFTIFKSDIFKDTLYKVKAIPNVLQFSRQYMEAADVMSTLFVLCAMLMTDFGTIVDERFTLQFLRAQGQDIVMKTLKVNSDIERIETRASVDTEPCLVAGLFLPLVCLCGLEEGRDWLKKNFACVHLIRVTDYLRTGTAIENFFSCQMCPPKFKKVWQSYLEFFDTTMKTLRVHNEADLLRDEERTKLKALKKRERKKLRRQKNKEAKDENTNKNANGKANSERESNKAVGAELSKARRAEDNVRYDQHVLMPDWNVCIENVRENDGNIIQTKRDPMQFRYNYIEPTHNKKTNGYHMPQTAPPIRNKDPGGQSEWQTVESKKMAKAAASTKQLQVNQNAGDSKKLQKRKDSKSKEPKRQDAPMKPSRVVGHVCWADVAKGTVQIQQSSNQTQPKPQHQQPPKEQNLGNQQCDTGQSHQPIMSSCGPRKEVFTYDEDFPTLKDDSDKNVAYDTDVSDVQSTSTISFCGEEQIDHIPDPATESDIMGTAPSYQREMDTGSDFSYLNPHMKLQLHQQPQFIPNFHIMGQVHYPPPSLMCRYGLDTQNPPPGFQEGMMQIPNVPYLAQNYGFGLPYPHVPMSEPLPPVTMANIAQSLLQSSHSPDPTSQDMSQNLSKTDMQNTYPEQGLDQRGVEFGYTPERDFPSPVLEGSTEAEDKMWRTQQQSHDLTDAPHLGSESGWKEDETYGQHEKEGRREHHADVNHDQSRPNEMADDFSKILSSLARCLSTTASESVLFPETLREDQAHGAVTTIPAPADLPEKQDVFPGFHEMESTVTANNTLNPLLLERLAKEQVKRQYRTIAGKPMLENSAYFHDFDYFASLYGMTTEELKLNGICGHEETKVHAEEPAGQVDGSAINCLGQLNENSEQRDTLNSLNTSEVPFPDRYNESVSPEKISSNKHVEVTPRAQTESFSPYKHSDVMSPHRNAETMSPDKHPKALQSSCGQDEASSPKTHSDVTSPNKHTGALTLYGFGETASPGRSSNYLSIEGAETKGLDTGERPEDNWAPQSRRWKDKLAQIIELPFSMRQQLGKIVVPVNVTGFKINKSGAPVVLGFLTDGHEVAVHELDADREIVDKDLVKKLASSDTKYNFLLRYKALAEMGSHHYLATELCDYTLEEYVTITRLDHHHDPLATNRLAWQLLKGIRYLHEDIGIVHGNLRPDNIYVDGDAKLRVGGYGIIHMDKYGQFSRKPKLNSCWRATEMFAEDDNSTPTTSSDVQVVGMLLYYILTGGRHPYGGSSFEIELNLCQNSTKLTFISGEANDLISAMLFSEPQDRPSIDACLRHPFFWSEEKRFRMVLIAGSDILKEMKTGVALTGSGSTTMTDFLNVPEHHSISDGWINLIDGAVLKEMRAFRQYKNTLAEMVLFIYNCCLHFDKMSYAAREALDDPCRYFLMRFPPLFMAVYRAIKESDRTDRSCYRPFF